MLGVPCWLAPWKEASIAEALTLRACLYPLAAQGAGLSLSRFGGCNYGICLINGGVVA